MVKMFPIFILYLKGGSKLLGAGEQKRLYNRFKRNKKSLDRFSVIILMCVIFIKHESMVNAFHCLSFI